MLLTYGDGPTTDYAKGATDVPAAVRVTIVLDGGYHRLAIEEVEKIFRQSLRAPLLGAGDSPPKSAALLRLRISDVVACWFLRLATVKRERPLGSMGSGREAAWERPL